VVLEQSDFGVQSGSGIESDDYEVLYNKDLEVGDSIEGEVYLSEIKDHKSEEDGTESRVFSLIITDHTNEQKWIISFWNPKEVEGGKKIYGKKPFKVYRLIDDFLSGIFGVPKLETPYHSVIFEVFREGINSKVLSVKAKAIQAGHRLSTSPDIEITEVVNNVPEQEV
jgi:hypothetical protein